MTLQNEMPLIWVESLECEGEFAALREITLPRPAFSQTFLRKFARQGRFRPPFILNFNCSPGGAKVFFCGK